MSDNLRECPFCGDGVIIDTNDNGSYWCLCISDKCIACGPIMYSEKEATEAWNTRQQPKHETVEHEYYAVCDDYGKDGKARIKCLSCNHMGITGDSKYCPQCGGKFTL